ncbi:peptidyl-prolyl cis-trans isomerase FKBP53 isoform X2 [Magnolia sinica]|uniref:peptidyl-prolyl cis-trans isomerase FKBP53 isoform X2 n=1 Tax=Magnolia sinica TaxID=86752 RepID=UPI0026584452|nr:peptidyl-prolyl cis-trans isomerase FKBP53 isoform X2 [Magnolia sinica]
MWGIKVLFFCAPCCLRRSRLAHWILNLRRMMSDSSYGEDIAEIDTDQSSEYDTEDELEDDFIDDSDIDIFPSAARPNSGVKIEEIVDDEKPANGKSSRKHLTEKNHLSESDDGDDDSQLRTVAKGTGAPVLESEDEDGFPLSLTSKSKSAVKNVDAKENSEKKTAEAGRKKEKKEKKKKKKQEDNSDQVTGLKRKIDAVDQDGEPESGAKQMDDSTTPSGEVAADKRGKSKKKRKEKAEKKNPEVEANVPTLETEEKETADQNAAIDDNKSDALNDQKSQLEDSKTDNMDQDVAVGDEPKEDIPHAKSLVVDADSAAADSQSVAKKKKKKKKKSKTQENDAADANQVESGNAMTEVKETLEQKVEVQPSKARTFSNGLVIEELSMGKPDGKRASPGNRVSVCYIGRLKKNGQIFDSNIGQRPFKFRLGIGQVIKGWDVGVAGMRIGDKRRLTIPPSMGYGSKGAGKIPANAWLVFDVELVDVL